MKIENIITGDHVRLRPMTRDDLPLKVRWYNDPDIRKTLILDETLDPEKTVQWFETIKDSPCRVDLMIETLDAEPIGVIGLVHIDRVHSTAEIFIVIGEKRYWGKGVMLEAESLLMDTAFREMGLYKIWACVRTDNVASVITMKKLGFQVEGTLRQHVFLSGRRVDVFQLGLLKDEFRPVHKI